ncbi:helix-turn-helix transcriptional regulator [Sandaracinus amylolyticus]|uniref:helix-turn-helix transcriptional regulator n=1 Tax=Sandaracinus amylolyticus TaxID=927083 RepID=UPI001F1671D9|nr:helix-turn-helix transcriptional regulator [Sandaracinus amylolyticus]UJR79044.1 Helix-turn-helix domain-containing protein [Sandaracinus amylolyticus]
MEHDDKFAAIVPGSSGGPGDGSVITGGSITGGEAIAVSPELETGSGGGAVAPAKSNEPAKASPGERASAQRDPGSPDGPDVAAREAVDEEEEDEAPRKARGRGTEKGPTSDKGSEKGKRQPNNVRRLRIERMMSKAELARRANLSVLTIDRVEKGYGCRMDSKRKILEALGLSLADRVRVFGEEE